MLPKLSSIAPRKINSTILKATQKAEDFMDRDKLMSHLADNKSKLIKWFEKEGVEIAVGSLTQSRCALLAEYIHAFLPFPVRLVVKEQFIAELIWNNVNQVISALEA